MSASSEPVIDDEEKAAAWVADKGEAWTLSALALGYNELTKSAETLGQRAFARACRDCVHEQIVAKGYAKVIGDSPNKILVLGSQPAVAFIERDIELMRACVAEWDAKVAEGAPAYMAPEQTASWLVIIHRDTETSVNAFDAEQNARAFFSFASEQWSESFLARTVIGPGPGFDAERAACARAAFDARPEQTGTRGES